MKITKYAFCLVFFSPFLSVFAQDLKESSNNLPKTLVLEGSTLERNYQLILANDAEKTKALKTLLNKSNKLLEAAKLYSVMDKKQLPPSGDKHDYMSTGPYWWPDPTKPDGLPYIKKDGLRNPTYYEISDSQEMDEVEGDAENLALAYYFTKDTKYAKWASRIIKTWFLDEATRQNPNLNFGQGVPGVNTGRGTGIIETRGLYRIMDAAILLQGTPDWSTEDHLALKKWFSDYLTWLVESPIGKDEADSKNNHGTYYSEQVIAAALFSDRPEMALSEIEIFKNRMESQLMPDGSQPLELARTKSWNYTNMNLYGYFLMGQLSEKVQINLWQQQISEGKNIKVALDWLLPYLKKDKKWEHQQIEKIAFGETIKILKMASQKYGDPAYEALAKVVDSNVYQSDRNQLTF